ncbi:OmpH family outer membrane protein [bacterium]|nr:MAG: OmpH family outer membrane protein [bacterium]
MLKKSIFILILLLGFSALSKAQNQKIGYIDSEYILSKIPEYSGIGERLSILSQQWKKELDEIQKVITDLEKDYEAKSILFTDDVKQTKLKEIEVQKQKLDQFRTAKYGPNGEYFKKQQELLEPLQQHILEAVNKIALRDNYDYIFDRTGDYLFLFTKPQWNLSDEVLLELGIEVEDSTN